MKLTRHQRLVARLNRNDFGFCRGGSAFWSFSKIHDYNPRYASFTNCASTNLIPRRAGRHRPDIAHARYLPPSLSNARRCRERTDNVPGICRGRGASGTAAPSPWRPAMADDEPRKPLSRRDHIMAFCAQGCPRRCAAHLRGARQGRAAGAGILRARVPKNSGRNGENCYSRAGRRPDRTAVACPDHREDSRSRVWPPRSTPPVISKGTGVPSAQPAQALAAGPAADAFNGDRDEDRQIQRPARHDDVRRWISGRVRALAA